MVALMLFSDKKKKKNFPAVAMIRNDLNFFFFFKTQIYKVIGSLVLIIRKRRHVSILNQNQGIETPGKLSR